MSSQCVTHNIFAMRPLHHLNHIKYFNATSTKAAVNELFGRASTGKRREWLCATTNQKLPLKCVKLSITQQHSLSLSRVDRLSSERATNNERCANWKIFKLIFILSTPSVCCKLSFGYVLLHSSRKTEFSQRVESFERTNERAPLIPIEFNPF